MNEWCHKLRKEGNQLERQINSIKREEEKVKRTLKEAAKKNDKDTCVILAKELIRSRKAINRIHISKAHLNSVQLQMKSQLGTQLLLLLITILYFFILFPKRLYVLPELSQNPQK